MDSIWIMNQDHAHMEFVQTSNSIFWSNFAKLQTIRIKFLVFFLALRKW
jgi:hypothetical protein